MDFCYLRQEACPGTDLRKQPESEAKKKPRLSMVHEISLYPHWMRQACGSGRTTPQFPGMPEALIDPDLALALFVAPTLLEDLSVTRLHTAEFTLSESFKFPRADSVESISINGSLVIIWFFSPPAW